IPKGVKEFTITTKAKEDASTEGTETGKFTVGGVEGNEVTVNDTSFKPELPIDITSIAGTEQPAGAEEANTPYAAISLQDISAGFTVSGTSQLEAGTVITVTINNPETIYRYSTSSRGWFMDT
ncbi:hypothetical protein, partial [Mesocricetibacter intestinalis]|uniref:hypothetical protein n=1 Tax=Mesocricetibacter intestinalis TaxID=1521930 RepID=UPI0014151735